MNFKGIIVDADFCIKIGASPKYRYLERVLKELADKVFIHRTVYDEVMVPLCAKEQLVALEEMGVLEIVDKGCLNPVETQVYEGVCNDLFSVMSNPNKPKKNLGEIHSLAYAKTKSIPYFATDEKDLQPIIDRKLNTGLDDISCVRIIDIIYMIKSGKLENFKRKEAKVLWRLSGKSTTFFDKDIWPI